MTIRGIITGANLAAAIFAVAAAPVAHAEDDRVSVSKTVRYADLDLGRAADAATMVRRIRSAAITVCLKASADPDVTPSQQAYAACIDEAVRDAVGRIRAPILTAVYEGKRPPTQLAQR